ncbi:MULTISPECIES: hypothetical protein [Lysinibacillus]|uniref:Uncharacterized protein n=1 Tax=Lysinibacillus boronitolerans JCM 21713 = 10a = NBRC 103108 TaxID=1294264 RepID=A0ABR4XWQ0_9BACI|nr:hypothetical protein [Lysinibacillus boronitolerans]KGR83174.1 hypothetical protein CD31_17490 [Lysinibacillus boronitolerans JCM 21713 = 10a = NBRC 103108]MCS1391712.1 hypothetical protein [Lysinibacillus boronitolerans]
MKGTGYSSSTALAQGELLAFHMTQNSMNKHSEAIQSGNKPQGDFPSNNHLCIGVLPFDVLENIPDLSIRKNKVNEVDFYHSGKDIARWLIKKSEYNKNGFDFI